MIGPQRVALLLVRSTRWLLDTELQRGGIVRLKPGNTTNRIQGLALTDDGIDVACRQGRGRLPGVANIPPTDVMSRLWRSMASHDRLCRGLMTWAIHRGVSGKTIVGRRALRTWAATGTWGWSVHETGSSRYNIWPDGEVRVSIGLLGCRGDGHKGGEQRANDGRRLDGSISSATTIARVTRDRRREREQSRPVAEAGRYR